MRITMLSAFAGASLLLSGAAFADDAKPVAPTPASATTGPDELICHPVTHEGRIVGKTCLTQKGWDEYRFRQQQQLRQYQQQSLFQSR